MRSGIPKSKRKLGEEIMKRYDRYNDKCTLPKYVLVSDYGTRILAAGHTLAQIRETRNLSGWGKHPNIRIYEFKE